MNETRTFDAPGNSVGVLPRPLTYDDLSLMPDDGLRREIIGGELIVNPAPSPGHQRVVGHLYRLIGDHARDSGAGEVLFAPVDVLLGRFDVVEQDLVYLSSERGRVADGAKGIEVPPDLVVEVISPSSSGIDRVRKMALYAGAGVAEYWIADPATRMLELYALEGDDYVAIQQESDGRLASRVLTGFRIDPTEAFAVLD